jgi:hypothetical protein
VPDAAGLTLQPLHYDPVRAILWSVGEDGQDFTVP